MYNAGQGADCAHADVLRTRLDSARADGRGYFGAQLGVLPTPVLDRAALASEPRHGPLVVQEYDTSEIVPPGCSASLDAHGSILVEVGNA